VADEDPNGRSQLVRVLLRNLAITQQLNCTGCDVQRYFRELDSFRSSLVELPIAHRAQHVAVTADRCR